MKRDLVNTACVISAIAFVCTLSFELITPSDDRPLDWSNLALLPDESALEYIASSASLASQGREVRWHGAWQSVAQSLLRADDPLAAYADFESALDPEIDRRHAVSGYSSYYLGYHLDRQERPELARLSWEHAVDRFRAMRDVDRPDLAHNDDIYLARSLMRLGRDEEAYDAIRGVPGAERGAPADTEALVLARTLAEIGHAPRAAQLIEDIIEAQPVSSQPGAIGGVLREGARWGRSNEPLAHDAAHEGVRRALLARFEAEEPVSPEFFALARRTVYYLSAHGAGDNADELLRAAAAAAERQTRRSSDADAALWAARFYALAGDPAKAASIIAAAPAGLLNPDDLVSTEELSPHLHREDLREAIERHGEPEERPWDDGP